MRCRDKFIPAAPFMNIAVLGDEDGEVQAALVGEEMNAEQKKQLNKIHVWAMKHAKNALAEKYAEEYEELRQEELKRLKQMFGY